MLQRKTASYRHSQGAVLLVSLVLLTAMTIIGVASIDSATLQSQMARNSLYAQNLYQKSLSEIEGQYEKLKGSDYLESILTSVTTVGPDNDPGITIGDSGAATHDAYDAYTQSVTVSYTGNGPPPSGYSVGIFIGKNFEVNSVSTVAGTGSESDQTQGLNYPAPL
jgi:Tfp pilus assembly protein PilX